MNSEISETEAFILKAQSKKNKIKRDAEINALGPHFKVRIVISNNSILVLSRTEPVVTYSNGQISNIEMDTIGGIPHGDTIYSMDYTKVVSVSAHFIK